jgi:hypothetical protein
VLQKLKSEEEIVNALVYRNCKHLELDGLEEPEGEQVDHGDQ